MKTNKSIWYLKCTADTVIHTSWSTKHIAARREWLILLQKPGRWSYFWLVRPYNAFVQVSVYLWSWYFTIMFQHHLAKSVITTKKNYNDCCWFNVNYTFFRANPFLTIKRLSMCHAYTQPHPFIWFLYHPRIVTCWRPCMLREG